MTEAKHSPLPWTADGDGVWSGPNVVAHCYQGPSDAALIVLATSLHHELVAALELQEGRPMSKEMLELADELVKCGAFPIAGLPGYMKFIAGFAMTEKKRDLIIAALRASAVAEPVARRVRYQDEQSWMLRVAKPAYASDPDIVCDPLYAHPAPAAPAPASVGGDLTDEIAKWLHEETNHPDSYPDRTWPETDRDDGQREGSWVKMVPAHALAQFRDIARRLIARFGASLPAPAAAPAKPDGCEPCRWPECGCQGPAAAPTREEIAKKLMEFDDLRLWELTEIEVAEYRRRANAILALKAAPAK